MRSLNLLLKRLIDIVGSFIGLLILSPLFFMISILIKATSSGPLFFKQERVGKNKVTFQILKFRTMKVNLEAQKNMDFSKDSERLTKLGKVLRRAKLDELPQLLNVLKGNMSLVGPRPTVMQQVRKYTDFQLQRLKMRPGMTGLAQVNGNIALPWEERIEYDIEYVNKFTIILDCGILIKTIFIVLLGEEKFKKESVKRSN